MASAKKNTNSSDQLKQNLKLARSSAGKLASNLKDGTVKKLGKVATSIKNIPSWLRSRPAAIKAWRRADRKKKKYRSFRLQKKLKPEPRYIPTSLQLLRSSLRFLYRNKKVFLSILLIQAVIYFALLRGTSPLSITAIQDSVKTVLGDNGLNTVQGNIATLSAVLSSSASSQANATMSVISAIIMSLVYIWAIRQLHNKKEIKARDAYYQGMTPLLPSLVVLLVASIQLIPFAVASFVYSTARTGGLFANGFEDLSIFMIALSATLLSFYWLTSTVIALYIVTIPGMWPMHALKAARQTIKFQRLTVFRRILALPIIIGVVYTLLLLLIIRIAPARAFLAVEVLQLLLLPLIHTYLFKLYRSFL